MGGLAKKEKQRGGHLVMRRVVNDKLKTFIYSVNTAQVRLGLIKWYSPWRRYNFFPDMMTTFDPICLEQIAAFCREETRQHDEKIRNRHRG